MRVSVGTSGFSYKEWKGSFYPATMKPDGMLAYYAKRLSAVEINNTFYRMPTRKMLVDWAPLVPDDFAFVLKAPMWITNRKDFAAVGDGLASFVSIAQELGAKLGPILFQLPPNYSEDSARLRELLAALAPLPGLPPIAFELRSTSPLREETLDALRAQGAALCLAESDDAEAPRDLSAPLIATADWGYLRLRRTDYTRRELADWVSRIRAQSWSRVYVFLKHEDEGKGPKLAMKLRKMLEE